MNVSILIERSNRGLGDRTQGANNVDILAGDYDWYFQAGRFLTFDIRNIVPQTVSQVRVHGHSTSRMQLRFPDTYLNSLHILLMCVKPCSK